MKNLLLALVIIVSGTVASARSILPPSIPVLECNNQFGVQVSISNYQGIGLGAIVTKRPIALPGTFAPQHIMVLKGFTPVSSLISSMQQVYQGDGFKMVISLESLAPTAFHPATLHIVSNDGRSLMAQVSCVNVK